MKNRPTIAAEFDTNSKAEKKSYIVFSTGRTGSTWLILGLYKLGLGIPMEYFNPSILEQFCTRWQITRPKSQSEVDTYLQKLYAYRTSENGWFGTTIHFFQWMHLWSQESTNLTIQEKIILMVNKLTEVFPNPHFIFLYRKDILMQTISLNIAEQTDAWSSDLKATAQPVYNYHQLATTLERTQFAVKVCKFIQSAVPAPKMELYYEDLEQNYNKNIEQILRLLNENIAIPTEINNKTIHKQRTQINSRWRQRFVQEHQRRQ